MVAICIYTLVCVCTSNLLSAYVCLLHMCVRVLYVYDVRCVHVFVCLA